MSGYAASARIVRAAPRLAQPVGRLDLTDSPHPTPDVVLVDDATVATGSRSTLAERWAAARERWSQLTFFLLDANSWR